MTGLPSSAGSVPTVLHDAADTGTDYILKHLILVGPNGGKIPGSAGSVPTVLHDATDTGTDYILKHLIVVGPKGGKMMPREPVQTEMNPARLV